MAAKTIRNSRIKKNLAVIAKSVQIVTFIVKDLEHSRKFYVDQLGLRVEREDPGRYFMVDIGPVRLCVDREESKNPAKGGGANLIFHVRDINATAEELKNRDIPYERHAGERGNGYLEVQDPEGYKLIFTERV